jgi:hypothetical protein
MNHMDNLFYSAQMVICCFLGSSSDLKLYIYALQDRQSQDNVSIVIADLGYSPVCSYMNE